MRTSFNQPEIDLLTNDGWKVSHGVAQKNGHEIVKISDKLFEVYVDVVEPDEWDDHWDWDSAWTSVEKAMKYCNSNS